jgi:cytochrome c-type biogenesis protein CcmH/NrfG
MVYIETKEFSKSTQYLSKALELSPDNEQIKNLLNIANNK